jgi:hypothetical protein
VSGSMRPRTSSIVYLLSIFSVSGTS